MRFYFLAGAAIALATAYMACKQEMTVRDKPAGRLQDSKASLMQALSTPCGCWIATTNQNSNHRIEVYDPAVFNWDTPAALKWSWKPATANGYSSYEVSLWDNPTDVKLRNTTVFSGTSQAIAASGGILATIAAYPSGARKWIIGFAPHTGVHSVELLPNGNIAVAAAGETGYTVGNWIRVYSSSQAAPNDTNYDQFNLASAHATLWDPSLNRLWVTGYLKVRRAGKPDTNMHVLTPLIVGGTAANPTLTEDSVRRSVLPGAWGHDVYPVYYDNNKLWVTMNTDFHNGGAYIYDKTTKLFTAAPGASNRDFVKSIGNQPSGQIVETRPRPNPASGWVTDTVDFYAPSGALNAQRAVTGAKFYKARVFDPDYQ